MSRRGTAGAPLYQSQNQCDYVSEKDRP